MITLRYRKDTNLPYQNAEMIMAFYALAATMMLIKNPGIKRVVFGSGGRTPNKHSFPLQEKISKTYPGIIGYREGSYDSADERFILAEQGHPKPEHLKLLEKMDKIIPDIQEAATADGLFVLAQGTDSYVRTGNEISGVSLNQITRRTFFDKHPAIEARLRANTLNPLLEEGFYESPEKRERTGEYFINFEVLNDLVNTKILNKPHYKITHCIMVDNDKEALITRLSLLNLQEGENVLIGLVYGVHAVAGYVERIDGILKYQIIDPEPGNARELTESIHSAFPGIKGRTNKERLQMDYYSCSTFLVKSFMYFAKHGREMLKNQDKTTPAPLLKMAQNSRLSDDDPRLETIVSRKKNLTLRGYHAMNMWTYREKKFNLAAIKAKYRYIEELGSPENSEKGRLQAGSSSS